jgi:hypothetical protein
LRDKFLINRTTSSGVASTILGIFAALLGVAAFANQSEECFVLPGPFPPCITSYQLPSLAPLYPLSAWLIILGSVLAIMGIFFTTLGQFRYRRTNHDISKTAQKPSQAN